jgi:hypothetical protein
METILGMVASVLAIGAALGAGTADTNSPPQNQSVEPDTRCIQIDAMVSRVLAREYPAEYVVWSLTENDTDKPPEEIPERSIDERSDVVWSFISGIYLRTDPSPWRIDVRLRNGVRWDLDSDSPLGPADSVQKGSWGVGSRFPRARRITPYRMQGGQKVRARSLSDGTPVEWHKFSYAEFAVVGQTLRQRVLVGIRLDPRAFFQAHPVQSSGPATDDPSQAIAGDDGPSGGQPPEIAGIHATTQNTADTFSERIVGIGPRRPGAIYRESEDNWLYVVVHGLRPQTPASLRSLDIRTSNGTLAGTLYASIDVSGVPRWKDRRRPQSVNPFLRVAVPGLLRDRNDAVLAFKGRYDLSKGFYLCGPQTRLPLAVTDNF